MPSLITDPFDSKRQMKEREVQQPTQNEAIPFSFSKKDLLKD